MADKAPIKVLPEYLNYTNIFLFDLAMELLENINMNKNTIKLVKSKLPPYGPIYGQKTVGLETLKTYIETHLKTRFI